MHCQNPSCRKAESSPFGGQLLEHIGLETAFVVLDALEHRAVEHHEPAVDPGLADLRLLGERADLVAVEHELAEAAGGRTTVIVASLPCSRWNATSSAGRRRRRRRRR